MSKQFTQGFIELQEILKYHFLTKISWKKAWLGLRGGSKTAATSKMERFVIIVNGFQPLTIITKHSILDVAVVLDPPLGLTHRLYPSLYSMII